MYVQLCTTDCFAGGGAKADAAAALAALLAGLTGAGAGETS